MASVFQRRAEVIRDVEKLQRDLLEIGLRGKSQDDLAALHEFLCDVQAKSARRDHPELDAFYCAACKGSTGHGPYCPWKPENSDHHSDKR